MWAILDALKERLNEDKYRAFPGSALAGKGGQGSVAGSIRDFRRNVAELLGRELGLRLEPQDVIETSKSGYRLKNWIVVKDLRGAVNTQTDSRVRSTTDDSEIDRQDHVLELIRAGERLRVPEIAKRLRCSYSTAKRAVDALKADGRIVFIGATKTGYYGPVEDELLMSAAD
jgi:hypothetical protein